MTHGFPAQESQEAEVLVRQRPEGHSSGQGLQGLPAERMLALKT